MKSIAILGAGASGMMAALAAAETGASVTLYERQARPGRKLSATGNGRCNLSNLGATPSRYHGDPDFAAVALSRFPPAEVLARFRSLGLLTAVEEGGRVYPLSGTAASVTDTLRLALESRGIPLITEEIQNAFHDGREFRLRGTQEYRADRLIIACGGPAGAKLGGTDSGLKLLTAFGHGRTKLYPALVQLKTDNLYTRALKGVRCVCWVRLEAENNTVAESYGEVQFTDYGISGPAVFDISRAAAVAGKGTVHLQLLPDMESVDIINYLQTKKSDFPALSCESIFTGALHNSISRVLLRRCGIRFDLPLRALEEKDLQALAVCAADFSLELQGTLGFDSAQVTAGGIDTAYFNPETMESQLQPGLYACGEVLNVDGDCGGFNLQWAWASGLSAGLAAGGSL